MEKKKIHIVLLLVACICLVSFEGQKEAVSAKYKAYFGCMYTDNIMIDANTFKEFMKMPLCAKDSANNFYKIKSFDITYAERGLYQDDEGKPIIFTDYSSDSFTGDTINSYWKKSFNERLYKGDTVFFDRIICTASDKKNFICKTLKVVIK